MARVLRPAVPRCLVPAILPVGEAGEALGLLFQGMEEGEDQRENQLPRENPRLTTLRKRAQPFAQGLCESLGLLRKGPNPRHLESTPPPTPPGTGAVRHINESLTAKWEIRKRGAGREAAPRVQRLPRRGARLRLPGEIPPRDAPTRGPEETPDLLGTGWGPQGVARRPRALGKRLHPPLLTGLL